VASILIHLTFGPEAPTRAALAFLVAKSAVADGHRVTLFLAGDAVQVLRAPTADAIHGIGTGSLREHLDALVEAGTPIYASGMSSTARGLSPQDTGGVPIEMATPNQLVQLALDHDRVLTY
jgi:predicted peroxiredoxin